MKQQPYELKAALKRFSYELGANAGYADANMLEALERIATGMWHTRACAALIESESEEPCDCDQEIAKAAIAKVKGITTPPAIKEEE